MTSAAFAFLLAVVVAAVLTPLVRREALRRGLVEGADGRLKLHAGGIPRLGGIAVVTAFLLPFGILFVLRTGAAALIEQDLQRFAVFCLGGLAIFALGLWDDLRGAGAWLKLSVEIGVALAVWAAGFRIDTLTLPFSGPLDLGPFGLIVTVGWIVGITNALNLVDGLDGLAAGVAFFAAAAHVVVGALNGNALLALFSAALAGAVLGFLPYNFNPARIFIGDSGALFLGYVLALNSIYATTHKGSTAVAVLGPMIILGLPILDTLLAMARRLLRGRPVFDGDREHVHHRLLHVGLSQRRSAWLLYGLCAAFALAGLMATAVTSRATAMVLLCLLVVLAVVERRIGLLRGTRLPSPPEGEGLVPVLAALREDLAGAADLDGLWDALTARAESLELHRVKLVEGRGGRVREWTLPGVPARPREGVARGSVALGRWATGARLEFEKRPFRRSREADDLFAALLAEYLREWPEAERPQERFQLAGQARHAHVRLEPPA